MPESIKNAPESPEFNSYIKDFLSKREEELVQKVHEEVFGTI
jgi:phosphoribosyl-ATP pyrophosphohydrolase